MKVRECYCCFLNRRAIEQGYYDYLNVTKQNIPRKKKKELKKTLSLLGSHIYDYMWDSAPCRCNLASLYKRHKETIRLVKFYKKNLNIFKKFISNWEGGVYLDNGRLSWYWEYDSDYGGSNGLMDFQYTKESAGNTWAYDGVSELLFEVYCHYVGNLLDNNKITITEYDDLLEEWTFPSEVNSDTKLITYIKKLVTYEKS